MVNDRAQGARAAGPRAGIPALHVHAGHVALALGVDRALGPAVGWLANVALHAAARG